MKNIIYYIISSLSFLLAAFFISFGDPETAIYCMLQAIFLYLVYRDING